MSRVYETAYDLTCDPCSLCTALRQDVPRHVISFLAVGIFPCLIPCNTVKKQISIYLAANLVEFNIGILLQIGLVSS